MHPAGRDGGVRKCYDIFSIYFKLELEIIFLNRIKLK